MAYLVVAEHCLRMLTCLVKVCGRKSISCYKSFEYIVHGGVTSASGFRRGRDSHIGPIKGRLRLQARAQLSAAPQHLKSFLHGSVTTGLLHENFSYVTRMASIHPFQNVVSLALQVVEVVLHPCRRVPRLYCAAHRPRT